MINRFVAWPSNKAEIAFLAPLFLLLLTSCGGPPEVSLPATATEGAEPTVTATEEPPKPTSLIVCLAEEPRSLYLYGDVGRSTDLVLEAIYDGPIDLLGFEYEPVLLRKVPSLADGDARIEQVSIAAGDVYLNPANLEPDTLSSGKPYLPSGCRSLACADEYDAGQVETDRMVAEFTLLPELQWSDGEPLTASDSVFSFDLQGHPETPASKYLFARTFSYQAVTESSVEWVGIPGFLDAEYPGNFWTPLPEHILGGLPPGELGGEPRAAERPLGWGAYAIQSWEPGRRLVLTPNEGYALAEEPVAFESLVFRFLAPDAADALDLLRSSECDLLDERLLSLDQLAEARAVTAEEGLALVGTPGSVVDRIDFNLQPSSEREEPNLVGDVRTRRALASCLDRVALAEELFGEIGVVPNSFLPVAHPDYAGEGEAIDYDPAAANELLAEVGWREGIGATGVRVAQEVEGVLPGTEFSLTLLTLRSDLSEDIGEGIRQDWADCGVNLTVEQTTSAELFSGWGEGPVFSRTFDAVLWGWPAFASPPCEMFASWELPSEQNPLGVNASGLAEEEYDEACRTMLLSAPGLPEYEAAVAAVQAQFTEQLPAIPLFVRPQFAAHRSWICGAEPDPSAPTVLWNLESLRPCS